MTESTSPDLGSSGARGCGLARAPGVRCTEPECFACALEWLLEPGNTGVAGQAIGMNGGMAPLRGTARA